MRLVATVEIVGIIGLLGFAAGCGGDATALFLTLDGPRDLTSIDVGVTLDNGSTVSKNLPLGGSSVELPGTVLVILPDRMEEVTLDVVGHESSGDLKEHRVVTVTAHEEARLSITLGEPADLGDDLTAAPGEDLAPDLSLHPDLSQIPDLSQDAAAAFPMPRLISTAFFSSQSMSAGMSHAGFSISTAGVVNGDLLLFIANVDNGSTSLWPNPIAAGFTQLAQSFFGSDGQTYVIDWKIASNEPATYSGTYSNPGSSAAVIALIAVSGANQTTPINAFVATNNGTTSASPTVATSQGVTTTAPNCTILFAAGSDWLSSPNSNTFTLPSGFTSLMQIGDHGDSSWDWTSQMVGFKTQAAAGSTGVVSGTLASSVMGIPWQSVIAIAP